MALSISNREVNGVAVMNLDGRVVFGEEATALRDKVKSLLDAGNKNLVLNVNSVTFIDSAGVHVILSLRK